MELKGWDSCKLARQPRPCRRRATATKRLAIAPCIELLQRKTLSLFRNIYNTLKTIDIYSFFDEIKQNMLEKGNPSKFLGK